MNDFIQKCKQLLKFLLRIPDSKSPKQQLIEEHDILYHLSMLITDLETEDRLYTLQEMIESIKSPELVLSPKEYIFYARDREWLIETDKGWHLTEKGSLVVRNFLADANL